MSDREEQAQTRTRLIYSALALLGGAFLAVMISLNSNLATYLTALGSSVTAHVLGTLVALLVLLVNSVKRQAKNPQSIAVKAPWWAYVGGFPGIFIVILAAVTVNGPLGLIGTLVVNVLGQTVFGLFCDHYGWFGMLRRPVTLSTLLPTIFILVGCSLVVTA